MCIWTGSFILLPAIWGHRRRFSPGATSLAVQPLPQPQRGERRSVRADRRLWRAVGALPAACSTPDEQRRHRARATRRSDQQEDDRGGAAAVHHFADQRFAEAGKEIGKEVHHAHRRPRTLVADDVEQAANIDKAVAAADKWHAEIVVAGSQLAGDPTRVAEAVAMVSPDGLADQLIAPVEDAIEGVQSIENKQMTALQDQQIDKIRLFPAIR